MNFLKNLNKNNWVFYLIIILVPLIFFRFTSQSFEIAKITSFRILLSVGFIYFFIKAFLGKKIKIPKIDRKGFYFLILILVLVISFLISTLFSLSFYISFFGTLQRHQGFLSFLHYIALFFLVIFSFTKLKDIEDFLSLGIFASFFVSVFGILQKFDFDLIIFDWNKDEFLGRIFSTLGHPNFLGSYLIMIIFPTIYFLIKKGNKKFIYFFVFTSQIIALFLTLNRSAWIGLFLGIILFLLLLILIQKKKRILYLSLALFFTPVLVIFIINFLPNDISKSNPISKRLLFSEENLRSFFVRSELWQGTWNLIKEKPIIGHGPETLFLEFPREMNKNLLEKENLNKIPDRAHNEIFDIAYSRGFLGLIVFYSIIIFTIGSVFIFIKKNKDKTKNLILASLVSSIFSVTVSNQFGFHTTVSFVLFWIFLGIIFSLLFISDSKKIEIKLSLPKRILALIFIIPFLINIIFNARLVQADYYFKKGDLKSMRLAVSLSPYIEYKLNLLNKFYNEDKSYLEEAKKILDDLKMKAPNFSDIYLLEGRIFMKNNKLSEASESFKKGIEISPFDTSIWRDYGDNLYFAGDYEGAIGIYKKYLELVPDYWKWVDEEKPTEEQKNKRRIFLKENPDFRKVFVFISRAYFQIQEVDKAIEILKYSDPEDIDALSTYGVVYGTSSYYEKALGFFKKALEIDPEDESIKANIKILEQEINKKNNSS